MASVPGGSSLGGHHAVRIVASPITYAPIPARGMYSTPRRAVPNTSEVSLDRYVVRDYVNLFLALVVVSGHAPKMPSLSRVSVCSALRYADSYFGRSLCLMGHSSRAAIALTVAAASGLPVTVI